MTSTPASVRYGGSRREQSSWPNRRVVLPDRSSEATRQIGTGRSPGGAVNSKSTAHTSSNPRCARLEVTAQPLDGRVIRVLDHVIPEGNLDEFRECQIRKLRVWERRQGHAHLV